MKNSTPLFKILAGFVLAGVVLLFGLQLQRYFSDPLTTTMVYKAETEGVGMVGDKCIWIKCRHKHKKDRYTEYSDYFLEISPVKQG